MLYKLNINNNLFKVAVADTDDLRYKGLSNTTRLGKNKGLLFIFNNSELVKMVMRGMNFPLDFIFIDDSYKITQINTLEANDKTGVISEKPCFMVLEVNKGICQTLNIKVGDKVEVDSELKTQCEGVKQFKHGGKFELVGDKIFEVKEDDIKIDSSKLQILNKDGEVSANVSAGTRIFSRIDTKSIIDLVKKGDLVGLGKLMVNVYDKHDKQKPDYVKNE